LNRIADATAVDFDAVYGRVTRSVALHIMHNALRKVAECARASKLRVGAK
jgi:hypothetical protein